MHHQHHSANASRQHPDRERGLVCVMGLGYIGLPTSAILASHGYRVHGVDVRPEVIATINRGDIHIHEPHLDGVVRDVVAAGRLSAHVEPCEADVFMICVPTPHHPDGAPDLSYVEAASRAIRPYVRPGSLIILESTSPPGTTRKVVVPNAVPAGMRVGEDVFVAHCPERVLPGRILIEAVENDRTVGGVTPACAAKAQSFISSFVTGKILTTNDVTAEMVKLIENSYRDVNIAFANEVSMLAHRFGINPHEMIELANRHPRVNILTPGPGVGGHCISVDPWFLVHAAPDATPLIRTAREVNDHKPKFVADQILQLAQRHNVTSIGCLGLAYKADVDDLRESPSIEIVQDLMRRSAARILACEPNVKTTHVGQIPLADLDAVIHDSQMLVLLTDHRQFRELNPGRLRGKILIDTRGAWNTAAAQRLSHTGPTSSATPLDPQHEPRASTPADAPSWIQFGQRVA